jgi:antitoxin VapB
MPLSIKDREVDLLARALAKETGETITEAVKTALRDRLTRTRRRHRGRRLADELDDIARRCSVLPVLDQRTPDEILGYDDRGLPG